MFRSHPNLVLQQTELDVDDDDDDDVNVHDDCDARMLYSQVNLFFKASSSVQFSHKLMKIKCNQLMQKE